MANIYYHIWLGIFVFATLAIRVFVDTRKGTRRKRVDGKRSMNGTYLAFFGATLQIFGIDVPANLPEPYNTIVRLVGAALAPMACILITWPRVMSVRNSTWGSPATKPTLIPEHQLVTWGPYRFVRHPYNLGLMLGVLATQLSLASAFVVIVPLAAMFFVRKLRKEEDQLEEVYGEKYREYKARTPAIIPWRIL